MRYVYVHAARVSVPGALVPEFLVDNELITAHY